MGIPAVFLAMTAMLFGGGVSAGQWTVVKEASVAVYSVDVTTKARKCVVLPKGKIHSAPAESERVFSYHRSGPQMPGECDATVRHIEISPNRLSEFAKRDW